MSYNDGFPTKKSGFRLFGWTLSGGAGLVLIFFVLAIIAGGITYAIAPWKGEVEARNNTIGNGQYVVASYDWYFDQYGAIQAAEGRYCTYKADSEAQPPPAPDQLVRLQAGMTAERNQWINLVNEYNANADKEKYKGSFRDDSLPEHIDNNPNNIIGACA